MSDVIFTTDAITMDITISEINADAPMAILSPCCSGVGFFTAADRYGSAGMPMLAIGRAKTPMSRQQSSLRILQVRLLHRTRQCF